MNPNYIIEWLFLIPKKSAFPFSDIIIKKYIYSEYDRYDDVSFIFVRSWMIASLSFSAIIVINALSAILSKSKSLTYADNFINSNPGNITFVILLSSVLYTILPLCLTKFFSLSAMRQRRANEVISSPFALFRDIMMLIILTLLYGCMSAIPIYFQRHADMWSIIYNMEEQSVITIAVAASIYIFLFQSLIIPYVQSVLNIIDSIVLIYKNDSN
jgi:hypothetical protein